MSTVVLLMLLSAPAQLPQQATVTEQLGDTLPGELVFNDTQGNRVVLSDMLDGQKPVLLVLAYYRCPMLCGLVLRGVASALQNIAWMPGEDYRVVTVSFDPDDTPLSARQSQAQTFAALGKGANESRWPFLVGDSHSIQQLKDSLGYQTFKDPNTGEWAHAAAIFVLTPKGKISRYLYGMQFDPKDVKLALFEASQGRLGTTIERFIMRCYAYDAQSKRYVPFVQNFLRLGSMFIGVAFFVVLGILWKRERHRA